jgi:RNA polymerase sigma-70 factor (ECF subfamily)
MLKNAFEAAVDEHQRRIFTFAAYFLSDTSEAEDVTQEVLLKLWRNRGMIRSENLGGWLLKVTRNACYDRLRKRRSAARVFAAGADNSMLSTATSEAPGPEALATATEYDHWLRKALGNLNEPQRSIVILREIQGLRYTDICETLDLPLTTVRVALHRARAKLRKNLKEVYSNASAA